MEFILDVCYNKIIRQLADLLKISRWADDIIIALIKSMVINTRSGDIP